MLQRARDTLVGVPWYVWLIASLALVLRLAIVPYGLPYEFDPDERLFVDAAWRMVESGTGDPDWYNVPASTLMDLLAAAYLVYGVAGEAMGSFDTIDAAGDAYRADVSHFFLIGRVITVFSGVGVVLMTYALARVLRIHAFWAAVAALLVALSFAMIQFSAIVRPDMLMTLFLLAAVALAIRALDQPSAGVFALAGVALGLAAASKYPGALGVVPIVAANTTLVVERLITPRRGLVWLGTTALCATGVAFVVGPFLFINVGDTLYGIAQEARGAHLGATGGGIVTDLWRYLTSALPWGMGLPAAAAGVVGTVLMLLARRPRVAAVTFWVYLLFIAFLALWWARWALPVMPLAAVGAGFLFMQLESRLPARRPARWVRVPRVAAAIVLVLPLVQPMAYNVGAQWANDDVRLRAIEWVHENVPDGSTLLIDSYTTQISSQRYEVLVVNRGEVVRWAEASDKLRPDGYFATIAGEWFGSPEELMDAIEAEGVDYIVIGDLWVDLFTDAAETYPDQLATYQALLASYPVVATFDNTDAAIGWHVTILDASAYQSARDTPASQPGDGG
jgi:hypothetical protein